MDKCRDCRYWQRLKNTEQSWGKCEWLKFNLDLLILPIYVKTQIHEYGSISPNQTGCKAFESD